MSARFNVYQRMHDLQTLAPARAIAALAANDGLPMLAREFAQRRIRSDWRDTDDVPDLIQRSGVGAVSNSLTTELVQTVVEQTVDQMAIARAPVRRTVFTQSGALAIASGATAAFVPEGSSIKVSKSSFTGVRLLSKKVSSLIVVTKETIELATTDDSVATGLYSDMKRAISTAADVAFASTTAAGAGNPAGIGAAASTVASTGITQALIATDVANLVKVPSDAGLPLSSGFFVSSYRGITYLQLLGLTNDAGDRLGAFPLYGANGVSGFFAFVVGDFVAAAVEPRFELDVSAHASIEMDAAPGASSIVPTPSTSNMISMLQANSVALRANAWLNFVPFGPVDGSSNFKAVVVLTSPTWA